MIFPQAYEDAIFLPFNHQCISMHFTLSTPDADPGGDGVWVVLHKHNIYVEDGPDGAHLPQNIAGMPKQAETFYCGQWDNQPCRVCYLPADLDAPAELSAHSLRHEEPILNLGLVSMGALAQHLQHWRANSRFCSACGNPLRNIASTWGRQCCSCGRHHFPHIHPCAIVLVQRGDQILLTRKPNWAPGRYSHAAGFMEPGENLEETAVREVLEETGIHIHNLRYCGSQAWPFPAQLMAGFIADYHSGEIRVDTDELEDAAWFSADNLPILPSRRSISRFMIDRWLADMSG